jgi:dihydrofolate synthase/folylpolyglutamate synthase
VITTIDLDHTEHLGTNLADIAREKAAVIKGGTCVLGYLAADAFKVVKDRCQAVGASLVQPELTPNADYHYRNRELSEAAANTFFPGFSHSSIPEYEPPPGRSEEVLHGRGIVVLEGAHNPAGARASVNYFAPRERFDVALAGVKRDKLAVGIVQPLAEIADSLIFCNLPTGDSHPAERLEQFVRERLGGSTPEMQVIHGCGEATETFLAKIHGGGRGLVFGSLYLVGYVRGKLGLSPR